MRRRPNFVDATANWLTACFLAKRGCWSRERSPGASPGREVSSDLEDLYSALSDRAGMLEAGGADTWRFASEAEQEFELVRRVPCQGRTVAQAAGELGRQQGLRLDRPVKENCRRIRDLLAGAAWWCWMPAQEIVAGLVAGGERTSTAVTRDTARILETPATPA